MLLKLKRKIGVRRDCDVRTSSPGDCLKAFMDPNFLGYMKAFVNSNMSNSNDIVSSSDIIAFSRVELMISFYKVRTRDNVNVSTSLHKQFQQWTNELFPFLLFSSLLYLNSSYMFITSLFLGECISCCWP